MMGKKEAVERPTRGDDPRMAARRRLETRLVRLNGHPSSSPHHFGFALSGKRRYNRIPHASSLGRASASSSSAVAFISRHIIAAYCIVFVFACFVGIVAVARGCTPAQDASALSEPDPVPAVSEASEAVEAPPDYKFPIKEAALRTIMGGELAGKLIQAAGESEDACWIAANPDKYYRKGSQIQLKLLSLAAEEPEAVSFVRGFPDAYPADVGDECEDPVPGEVPHLYQWDVRWGYTVYSSNAFALTGCGPTAFAMVYQGLTGKGDLTPYDMGVLARKDGYMEVRSGTKDEFMLHEAPKLGLVADKRDDTADSLVTSLQEGYVAVLSMKPGDFTDGGHYIVACGIDDDGQVVVNDPYSAERSARPWDAQTLTSQSKYMFVFHLA